MIEHSTTGGTVAKALAVLDLVAAQKRPVRFSDLSDDSPYPKATLYRLLQTLVAQGLLIFDAEANNYTLGMRFLRLAHVAWQQSSLVLIARPYLDQLSAEIGENVYLAQLDNAHVVYVDKRNAYDAPRICSQVSMVRPAYCTGVGKAMLASLPEAYLPEILGQQSWHRLTVKTLTSPEALKTNLAAIRACGYALDNEEYEPGTICVAVPILPSNGTLLGALSIASTTSRTNLQSLEAFVPNICKIARTIAAATEKWRFP